MHLMTDMVKFCTVVVESIQKLLFIFICQNEVQIEQIKIIQSFIAGLILKINGKTENLLFFLQLKSYMDVIIFMLDACALYDTFAITLALCWKCGRCINLCSDV